jgi:hypothetical protein
VGAGSAKSSEARRAPTPRTPGDAKRGSLLLLLVLKLLLRRERLVSWLLVAVLTLVQALGFAGGEGSPWLGAALAFVIMASFTLLLWHIGVVACILTLSGGRRTLPHLQSKEGKCPGTT